MASMEQVSFSLSSELKEKLKRKVKEGEYSSMSALLRLMVESWLSEASGPDRPALFIRVQPMEALPVEPPPTAQGEDPPNEGFYIVKGGDTLFSIAASYQNSGHPGVTWGRIASRNGIDPDRIYVGQPLIIPLGSPDTDWEAGRYSHGPEDVYIVKGGDALSSIAANYPNVTWFRIATRNNIRPPNYIIYPGQTLYIPLG